MKRTKGRMIMMGITFETLILPSELYFSLIKTAFLLFGVSIVFSLVIYVYCLKTHYRNKKIKLPITFGIDLFKLLISLYAVGLVFLYDYELGTIKVTDFEDMLFTTFLIGILAFIEVLSSIIAISKELMDICG